MLRLIVDLAGDWRRLDARVEAISGEIEELARKDQACERLMTVPGIGPIISSAIVAAIGTGDAFSKGRDFGAWLGLVPKQISTEDRTILGGISLPDVGEGCQQGHSNRRFCADQAGQDDTERVV
jgi:transposase